MKKGLDGRMGNDEHDLLHGVDVLGVDTMERVEQ